MFIPDYDMWAVHRSVESIVGIEVGGCFLCEDPGSTSDLVVYDGVCCHYHEVVVDE